MKLSIIMIWFLNATIWLFNAIKQIVNKDVEFTLACVVCSLLCTYIAVGGLMQRKPVQKNKKELNTHEKISTHRKD